MPETISWSRRMDRRHDAFGTRADDPAACQCCKQPLTPETALAVHEHYDDTPATLEFCSVSFDALPPDGGAPLELRGLLCVPCSHRYHQRYDKSILAAALEGSVWEGAKIL